ncbi:MAG: hypothetical protein KDD33_01035 [Bdellovibrionales bacterium]|nr:hypothetical protein [Bdellovibrionales bacterium]
MNRQIYIFILLLFAQSAFADFEFYRGVRQMGMGGASIAVVNDETSVLSNANGLGKLRDYFFTVVDPEVTASANRTDVLSGTLGLGSVSPQDLYDELSRNPNQPYYFKSQIFPSVVVPNFGVGLLGKYEVLAQRNSDGTYDYNYLNDYGLVLGYNLRFWGGRIKWGFTGKMINRVQYHGVLDPSTDSLDLSAFASEGLGVGLDSGLTLAGPWFWIPTLTVYIRDVGHTSFTTGGGIFGMGNNGDPAPIEQSVDAAFAIFPILSNHSRATFTVEYTNLLDTKNVDDHMDRTHIGMEVNVWDAYFFRAGYHQNDWTAGLEYSTDFLQFQMATYSEPIIVNGFEQRDRRGIFKFAMRF